MRIIVHRTKGDDARNAFSNLYDLLMAKYPDKTKFKYTYCLVIEIDDIHIEFIHGDVNNLYGIWFNYYNTDNIFVSNFLDQTAFKLDGKELNDISDIYNVIVEHIEGTSRKICVRCAHYGDSPDIPESQCYLCRRNINDNRIDWFEERRNKENEQ